MKKLLLSAVFAMVALTTTFAAQLNPFAYNLRSSLSTDQSTLTVYYSLNATATGVKVLVMNGDVVVKEVDCNAQKTLAGGAALSRGDYKVVIETSEFPLDTDLTWKVEVKGTSVAKPSRVTEPVSYHSFYFPHSIAIDKNPESTNFGRIFVTEPYYRDDINTNTISKDYVSKGSDGYLKSGLYVFTPDFYVVNNGGKGYTGGNTFYRKSSQGHQPWMVCVSEDGRIFVSSGDGRDDGVVVWEVNPENLNEWTPVIKGVLRTTADANTYGKYCVYKDNTYKNFIAGINCSMDVKGSGENLKLLLYSVDNSGMQSNIVKNFLLHEYHLGTAKQFTGTPTAIDLTDASGNVVRYAHFSEHAKMYYDGDYGYWFGGYVSYKNSTELAGVSLAHALKGANGKVTQKTWRKNEQKYNGGSGVKIHKAYNGEEWLFKGVENTQKFQIYRVTRESNGTPLLGVIWDSGFTDSDLETNCNDFEVDYAENVFIVGNNGEKIVAYKLPYSGTVSTPAAKKYTFEITKPNYDHPENHLAPFAYDLRKTIEGDGRTKLHFMLNAHARKVQVVLIDETKEDGDPAKEIILREYPNAKSEYKDFIPYHTEGYGTVITTEDVDTLGLEYGKNYSWRVDVWGKEVASKDALKCAKSYSFYCPSAVDIDNNPNNQTFGTIFTNEALHEVKGKSGYMGSGYGAGLYAFTADFKPIKNGTEPGFNGGNEFMNMRPGYENKEVKDIYKAHTPRRIRVSEDGRIFVTSLNTNGTYLWEVTPEKFNEWTPVFKGASVNANNEILDGSGNFIVGPNSGFDVKGRDEHLQLMMYSVNKQGIDNATMSGFKCAEYNLGTEKLWSTKPSKMWIEGKYAINCFGTQVEYDNEGGFWIASYRDEAIDANPGLVHINAAGKEDAKLVWSKVRNAGIRFNKDFTKLVVAGNNGTTQKATIYTVSKDANGKPVLTEDLVIDMSLLGNNLNDFAWDYAGNLYACSNSLEKVAAYVMPRSANDKVSTPAREGEIVNLTQPVPRIVAYNLTYRPNGATKNYDFSFYANTQPTGGSISFYKNGETTPLYVHQISNLIQGDNTVSIPMATLDAYLNYEKDITWELTLSAPQSQVFGRIYKSGELNTAYATINTNPATDYFGHVYAGNQQDHVSAGSGGNIYVWAPGSGTNNNQGDRYHTIKTAFTPTLSPNNKNGFTQVSAPGIAPDGKVYFTDNGKTGGVYVMDPKDYSITSFFEGLAQNEIAQYLYNSNPVGTPSSSAHIYWPGGNTAKLFLVSTEYYTKTNIGSQGSTLHRHNAGYYIYPLTEQDGRWVHNRNWGETQKVAVTEDNIYQPNFTIVGTSHGAWYCQHRRNDLDVVESRSLMFFGNDGKRKYCSTDDDEIYGSCGSAIAVNKEETLLAMASGLGGIMFFKIEWDNDNVPTLDYLHTSALNNNDVVTTLNFDYNGNLVATVGDTYNDATDKHRMVVFTMPKEGENTVTVPARFSQRVAALYADERMDVHFDENITKNSPYQTVDVFRRLQAGMYNTICLPFSLNSLENTPYAGAKVMKFTGVTSEMMGDEEMLTLNFQQVTFSGENIMQAGVPYLIQPAEDIADLVRFSPVQVNASFNNEGLSVTQGSGTNAITFHGAIDPTTLSVNQNCLFLVANNRLATASAGGDMLGLRGYFTVKGEFPAKAVISFREGVTTGTTSTVTPTTDGVQKVLQNQQILIIRDGETYNILGEHINTK